MAPRTLTAQFEKLLEAVAEPVYAVDEDRRILYLNPACAKLVGQPEEDLIDKECRYHSLAAPGGPVDAATALCPPPEAMAGQRITGQVLWPDDTGRMRTYRADFLPLGEPPQVSAVLAVLSAAPLTDEASPAAADAIATELHERLRRYRAAQARHYDADRLLGDSPAMRLVRNQVSLAAKGKGNILILGPPGSGRQHVARTIHYYGSRHTPGSLVPLDCGMLSVDVLRSTIGALTQGGPARRTATTGTLILAEVDLLNDDAQYELNELLAAADTPLRVVSTAQQDLAPQVAAGKFRHDLACVLSTLSIRVPPLAERTGDIPLLAQLVLEEINADDRKQLSGFSPQAMDLLVAYHWPENVAELKELIRQAHASAEGPHIQPGDLPQVIHFAYDAARLRPKRDETIDLEAYLANIEIELIRRALARTKGNKSKAARLLGMNRPRFYRRLEQLGLEDELSPGSQT